MTGTRQKGKAPQETRFIPPRLWQLMYLNKYSVYKAFGGLRDRGFFPCICKDTPFGKWCNFPIVLNAFGILYCHSEGLFKYTVYLRFFPWVFVIFFIRTYDFLHVYLRFFTCVLANFAGMTWSHDL